MNDEWRGGYDYFSVDEMRCKGTDCDCRGKGLPKHSLMLNLIAIRKEAGFPLIISSGFRCSSHNAEVSESGKDGPHTYGLAVDVKVFGDKAYLLIKLALKYGVQGIGVSQKGKIAKRYLHFDWVKSDSNTPRPFVWSY